MPAAARVAAVAAAQQAQAAQPARADTPGDRVSVSATARALGAQAPSASQASPARLEALRQAIAEGSLELDLDAIADGLMADLGDA